MSLCDESISIFDSWLLYICQQIGLGIQVRFLPVIRKTRCDRIPNCHDFACPRISIENKTLLSCDPGTARNYNFCVEIKVYNRKIVRINVYFISIKTILKITLQSLTRLSIAVFMNYMIKQNYYDKFIE